MIQKTGVYQEYLIREKIYVTLSVTEQIQIYLWWNSNHILKIRKICQHILSTYLYGEKREHNIL